MKLLESVKFARIANLVIIGHAEAQRCLCAEDGVCPEKRCGGCGEGKPVKRREQYMDFILGSNVLLDSMSIYAM